MIALTLPLVPDLPEFIINPADFPNDYHLFYDKFSENSAGAPFLILEYWLLVLSLILTVGILVPLAWCCKEKLHR